MRISDWSSDVCSSDLCPAGCRPRLPDRACCRAPEPCCRRPSARGRRRSAAGRRQVHAPGCPGGALSSRSCSNLSFDPERSEEHTSELQSLMRISYAVFCLKKKTYDMKKTNNEHITNEST